MFNRFIVSVAVCSPLRQRLNLRNVFSDNPDIQRTAKFLIDNRLAAFVGSNAHNTEELAQVKDGIRWVYDHCPEKYADAIIHDNAYEIVKTQD